MQVTKKLMAISVALLLIISMATAIALTPTAQAHDPKWNIPTFAYIHVAPNPVGVGQKVLVVMWIDKVLSGASLTNSIRFHNYKLTITKPDGQTETMNWETVWDTTSSQYTPYTPTQVGNYTFTFVFPKQDFPSTGTYQNDTFLANSASVTLTVQEEQLPDATRSYPLPAEYWTHPIEGQNTDWWTISSNWLGTGSPQWTGGRKIQPDGLAPNSAHVMWTRPIQDGGVVPGSEAIQGEMFYAGLSYNQRFTNVIIMNGRVFYELPSANAASGGGYMAVDLRTGEQLWYINRTAYSPALAVPSFGYYYSYEHPNQHGILPNGMLFTSNFGRAIDARTGQVWALNLTNVPSGTAALGPSGEHLRYVLTNNGNTTNPRWYLAQWNSSRVFNTQTTGNIPANCPITPAAPDTANTNWNGSMWVSSATRTSQGYATVNTPAYDWNVSVPPLPGLSTPTIIRAAPDQFIFGRSCTFQGTSSSTTFGTPDPFTFWAVSIKPDSTRGSILWIKNYTAPTGNFTLIQGADDPISRVFTIYIKETTQWYGYSMDDGGQLWGPTAPTGDQFDYYNALESVSVNNPVVYGNLYVAGYGGILYCYGAKNGTLLWTYGNGGEGNSTYSGFETVWGHYPIWIGSVADGKIYLHTSEHSPNTPIYKNSQYRCIDAYTGKEVWTVMGFGGMFGPTTQIFAADGYVVYLNSYDMQIYSIGKGPSALTVTAPDLASQYGAPVIIRGTVTDIAAGTKQDEQAARFPNGVPAVSDESMSSWMEYVYMQKPKPTNATGVPVKLDVVDANGNYRTIGTATSDSSGMFTFTWTPDIEGTYYVVATFAGSESYWPSSAETSFVVNAPAATSSPYPLISVPSTEMYFAVSTAAIIIAIAIATIVLYRRK